MEGLTTLGEVLAAADRLAADADVFLPFDQEWEPATRCAVVLVDRYAEEPAVPDLATRYAMQSALQAAQVQDVVDNARQQRPRATAGELVQAFRFFYDRDAFIDFSHSAEPHAAADRGLISDSE